ncbi:MAG: hypothetical protein CMB31_06515 [Euryarchaeota archaeon]|nr:hypothetical protein [Euryarchaeota archaeon]
MGEKPEPIILTDSPKIPIQVEEKENSNPGKDSLVFGFIFLVSSIIMFSTLDEFCCLMGLLALISGCVFLVSGVDKTRKWRKENDIKKWTIGEILVAVLLCFFGLLILEVILLEVF